MAKEIRIVVWAAALLTDLAAVWMIVKALNTIEAMTVGKTGMDAAAVGIGGAIVFVQAIAGAVIGTCIALAVEKLTRA